jgi:hypothetical protein
LWSCITFRALITTISLRANRPIGAAFARRPSLAGLATRTRNALGADLSARANGAGGANIAALTARATDNAKLKPPAISQR